MRLFINGQQADVTLEDEKTVGDVLASFEKTCEENGAAVTGIQIDGKTITAETFDGAAAAALTEDVSIALDVITRQAVTEAMKAAGARFSGLSRQMESVPSMLQTGRDAEARAAIASLADAVGEFCRAAAAAAVFPDAVSAIVIDGKNISDFFSDFPAVLSELEQALKSNDTVLIGDIAEYEICPRLNSLSKAIGENT